MADSGSFVEIEGLGLKVEVHPTASHLRGSLDGAADTAVEREVQRPVRCLCNATPARTARNPTPHPRPYINPKRPEFLRPASHLGRSLDSAAHAAVERKVLEPPADLRYPIDRSLADLRHLLACEVWGLGFGSLDLGFEVWGLGFEVRGLGFEVDNSVADLRIALSFLDGVAFLVVATQGCYGKAVPVSRIAISRQTPPRNGAESIAAQEHDSGERRAVSNRRP